MSLKGSSNTKNLSLKPHIFVSNNGVMERLYLVGGAQKTPNILVSKFVGLISLPLEVLGAPPFEVSGDKIETKIFKLGCFLDSSDQNELYHTPLLSKM